MASTPRATTLAAAAPLQVSLSPALSRRQRRKARHASSAAAITSVTDSVFRSGGRDRRSKAGLGRSNVTLTGGSLPPKEETAATSSPIAVVAEVGVGAGGDATAAGWASRAPGDSSGGGGGGEASKPLDTADVELSARGVTSGGGECPDIAACGGAAAERCSKQASPPGLSSTSVVEKGGENIMETDISGGCDETAPRDDDSYVACGGTSDGGTTPKSNYERAAEVENKRSSSPLSLPPQASCGGPIACLDSLGAAVQGGADTAPVSPADETFSPCLSPWSRKDYSVYWAGDTGSKRFHETSGASFSSVSETEPSEAVPCLPAEDVLPATTGTLGGGGDDGGGGGGKSNADVDRVMAPPGEVLEDGGDAAANEEGQRVAVAVAAAAATATATAAGTQTESDQHRGLSVNLSGITTKNVQAQRVDQQSGTAKDMPGGSMGKKTGASGGALVESIHRAGEYRLADHIASDRVGIRSTAQDSDSVAPAEVDRSVPAGGGRGDKVSSHCSTTNDAETENSACGGSTTAAIAAVFVEGAAVAVCAVSAAEAPVAMECPKVTVSPVVPESVSCVGVPVVEVLDGGGQEKSASREISTTVSPGRDGCEVVLHQKEQQQQKEQQELQQRPLPRRSLPTIRLIPQGGALAMADFARYSSCNAASIVKVSPSRGFEPAMLQTELLPGLGALVVFRFNPGRRVTRDMVCRLVVPGAADAEEAAATSAAVKGPNAAEGGVEGAPGTASPYVPKGVDGKDGKGKRQDGLTELFIRLGPDPANKCHLILGRPGTYRMSYRRDGKKELVVVVKPPPMHAEGLTVTPSPPPPPPLPSAVAVAATASTGWGIPGFERSQEDGGWGSEVVCRGRQSSVSVTESRERVSEPLPPAPLAVAAVMNAIAERDQNPCYNNCAASRTAVERAEPLKIHATAQRFGKMDCGIAESRGTDETEAASSHSDSSISFGDFLPPASGSTGELSHELGRSSSGEQNRGESLLAGTCEAAWGAPGLARCPEDGGWGGAEAPTPTLAPASTPTGGFSPPLGSGDRSVRIASSHARSSAKEGGGTSDGGAIEDPEHSGATTIPVSKTPSSSHASSVFRTTTAPSPEAPSAPPGDSGKSCWGHSSTRVSHEERLRRSKAPRVTRVSPGDRREARSRAKPAAFPEDSWQPGGGYLVPEGSDDRLPPPSDYEVQESQYMMKVYEEMMERLRSDGMDEQLPNGFTPKIYDLTSG